MGPDVNLDIIKTNVMRGKFCYIILMGSIVVLFIDLSYLHEENIVYHILNPVLLGLAFVLQSLLNWRSQRMRLTCLGLVVFVLVVYNQR